MRSPNLLFIILNKKSFFFAAIRQTEFSRRGRQRSISQTNLNQLDSADRRATYGAGLRRSASNSNLRTPQANRSPTRATPNFHAEQNRKLVTENSQKVMEILQIDKVFFGRLNLTNGLKSMTAKQFIEIVAHFSMKICGKNMIQSVPNGKQKSKPEVEIMAFLQMLNYPYVINKSCLKTPNAQHMFKECVALLAWLSDIVRFTQKTELTELPMLRGQEFPSDEYAKLFSNEVQNAFHLWNEESEDEFANIQNGLVEKFIQMKMGVSPAQLLDKTEQLEKTNAKLVKVNATDNGTEEKYFEKMKVNYNKLKDDLNELQRSNAIKMDSIQKLTTVYRMKAAQATEKDNELAILARKVQNQKYSVDDVQLVMHQTAALKQSIESSKAEISKIRNDATDIQVKVARLKQQRISAINDLNQFAYKIAQIMAKTQLYEKLNVNDLHIDVMAASDAIEMVCGRLKRLYDGMVANKQRIEDQIERRSATIEHLNSQQKLLVAELKALMSKYQKVNKISSIVNERILVYELESQAALIKLQVRSNDGNYEELLQEIATKREEMTRLEEENLKIFRTGEECIYENIRQKQIILKQLDDMNKTIENVISEEKNCKQN